jgi:hypothetical protein
MDFDRCLSYSHVLSTDRSPAGKKTFDTARPDARHTMGAKCSVSQYGAPKGGVPAWVGVKAPEYAKQCGPRGFGNDSFAKLEAEMEILKHYCGLKPKVVEKKVDLPGFSYSSKSERMTMEGPAPIFSSTPPATYTTSVGDKICVHVYYNWDKIICPGGKVVECK